MGPLSTSRRRGPDVLVALVPLITALLAGATVPAALAGLGLAGWAAIAEAALTSLPAELEAVSKLHPLLAKVAAAAKEGTPVPQVAQMAHNWTQENYEASLRLQPGMGGGVAPGDY